MPKAQFDFPDPPSGSAFPVAKPGIPWIAGSAFVALIFALLEMAFPAILFLALTVFICFFFRDPDRAVPQGEGLVVSPADGKVIFVGPVSGSPFDQEGSLKISIFMSIFNVHVNRIPEDGTIREIRYFPGRFVSANLDKASADNERNALRIETPRGTGIVFVQIAGLVARRILCSVREGDAVRRGQRFGMICFGSRLDVYLPKGVRARVAKGVRVRAGTTVLAELP